MKKQIIIFTSCLIFLSSCLKISNSPTNKLPHFTTQGLNTMGCLVNDNVFVPQEPIGDGIQYYQCYYGPAYTGSNPDIFNLTGTDKPNGNEFTAIQIFLDSLVQLHQGDSFQLKRNKMYGVYTSASVLNGGSYINYVTTDTLTGQINILFLDESKGIVSGTFRFDATDGIGDTVHITQGRFDMTY